MFELKLSVSPREAADTEALERIIKDKLDSTGTINRFQIVHRSIDARSRSIRIHLTIRVYIDDDAVPDIVPSFRFSSKTRGSVIIAGAGPAGLFAALRLLEAGISPILIERGKTVRDRRRDIALLSREHIANPDSNYCFGEGGAGTYSDGKLYTRSTKRGDVLRVLQLLVYHGAGEEILSDAHPHIGTNKLPRIIENIRKTILSHGGEIHFETRLMDVVLKNNQVKGIMVQSVKTGIEIELATDHLILATGHSARDIYKLLHAKNILLESKPFAMGVRAEHPQALIDGIQYHCRTEGEVNELRKFLPAASYHLVHQVRGRGVYSFCMCPGGVIAPCATLQDEVVVNGWSPSKRNNPYANSGIVMAIEQEDLKEFSSYGIFAGLHYQKTLEHMAFKAGGETQAAPAQRMTDFVNNKISSSLPSSSYQPGIVSAPLHELLPPKLSSALQEAFLVFGKKMPGYFTKEAVIHGVESRTSSPVRIPRVKETLEHPHVKGLYPVGEGAGYAGGIVSAALDGQNSAERIAQRAGSAV